MRSRLRARSARRAMRAAMIGLRAVSKRASASITRTASSVMTSG